MDAGLIWIGPSPQAIEQMGDKMSARQIMKAAGVPVIPVLRSKKRMNHWPWKPFVTQPKKQAIRFC